MKIKSPIAVILSIMLLVACGKSDQPGATVAASAPGTMPPPPEVEVVTIAAGNATLTQELPGRLQAVRTAQIRARVEGIVEKRLFTEGSDVKAGAPLFQLDDRTYRTAATSAEADLQVATQTVERYRPLLEIKAISRQDFDLAEAKQKQAEAALAKARLDLENSAVPAPISGHIGRALVTEGALVGKGEATLLATIDQLNPIYAIFTQSNANMLRLQRAVKAGQLKKVGTGNVELVLEDGTTYGAIGQLDFSDLAVDPNTGTVQMRAVFPNPKHELLPGTFVRIRFPEANIDGAIKVPQRAIMMSPLGQTVMVVGADGNVAVRPIKPGGMAGTDWIIEEGLKPGDKVIVNGLQKVQPGKPAKPVELSVGK
jgi:membrane fusion protein (multidrug efflux system)